MSFISSIFRRMPVKLLKLLYEEPKKLYRDPI